MRVRCYTLFECMGRVARVTISANGEYEIGSSPEKGNVLSRKSDISKRYIR